MKDPSYALQVAFVTKLKSLMSGIGARVYDTVPEGAQFPYVSLGPTQTLPLDETCNDPQESYAQIDIWSRAVGFPEVKQLSAVITSALDENTMPVTGHRLDRMLVRSVEYTRDPDGLTNRARIEVQIFTTPE